jgi:DNA-nicking Smr family endonuclease
MKSRKSFLTHNPFRDLKVLLKAKSISLPGGQKFEGATPEREQNSDFEEKLFNEAMEGVIPISRDNCVERIVQIRQPEIGLTEGSEKKEDAETLSKLTNLVKDGTGFNILETPEYIEGTGYNVHPEVARRLHRGDYSIQAHVDLHRLDTHDAREVFEKFLKRAVIAGKRGVLIIHGRGLSSPAGPVLKSRVTEWLTRGPWRKWVIAYCSARSCDGGAGATYVLLRQRPVSKRTKIRTGELKRKSHVFLS